MRRSVFDRYNEDHEFRTLVDVLYGQLLVYEFTPTELREACHVAACKYESTHVRQVIMTNDEFERIPADIKARFKP